MLAQAVALELGIPFIYAKKKRPITMTAYFAAASYSFTKQESTTLYVSREVFVITSYSIHYTKLYDKRNCGSSARGRT